MKYSSACRSYVHACHLDKSERDARHFWTWRDWLGECHGLLGGLGIVREACLTRGNSDAVASQRQHQGPFSKPSLCIDDFNELFSFSLNPYQLHLLTHFHLIHRKPGAQKLGDLSKDTKQRVTWLALKPRVCRPGSGACPCALLFLGQYWKQLN